MTKEEQQEVFKTNKKLAETEGLTEAEIVAVHQAVHCNDIHELKKEMETVKEVVAGVHVVLSAAVTILGRKGTLSASEITAEIEANRAEQQKVMEADSKEENWN